MPEATLSPVPRALWPHQRGAGEGVGGRGVDGWHPLQMSLALVMGVACSSQGQRPGAAHRHTLPLRAQVRPLPGPRWPPSRAKGQHPSQGTESSMPFAGGSKQRCHLISIPGASSLVLPFTGLLSGSGQLGANGSAQPPGLPESGSQAYVQTRSCWPMRSLGDRPVTPQQGPCAAGLVSPPPLHQHRESEGSHVPRTRAEWSSGVRL